MGKCPKCGAKEYRVRKAGNEIILQCSGNPQHIRKRKVTPKQMLREVQKTMRESPVDAYKRHTRLSNREKQEKRE